MLVSSITKEAGYARRTEANNSVGAGNDEVAAVPQKLNCQPTWIQRVKTGPLAI